MKKKCGNNFRGSAACIYPSLISSICWKLNGKYYFLQNKVAYKRKLYKIKTFGTKQQTWLIKNEFCSKMVYNIITYRIYYRRSNTPSYIQVQKTGTCS